MNSLKRLFLNEIFIITIILLNSVLIFLEGFPNLSIDFKLISTLHYLFLIIYVFELIFKINEYGFKNYIKEGLNKLDFVLVLISIPELITIFVEINTTDFSFLFTLRSIRLIRIVRLFRVVALFESSKLLFRGIKRALKSSYLILFVFVLINFIFALLSHNLFSNIAPDYFGDPLKSLYSIFKVFTIEGWYEIPDIVTEKYTSQISIWAVRLYFILVLFIGGIFGLSIINSVFVEGVIHDEEEDKKLDEIITRLDNIENKLKK
tara:strand:- start:2510 stop:3298 length:789 start_codon:yes stop_codon:yes gene_type:complete